jgi:large subunit ribosomal protein L18
MATSIKIVKRQKIKFRLRKKIKGTAVKPRLSIFRSNTAIYAQLINDVDAVTICAASSRDKDVAAIKGTKSDKSKMVGEAIGKKASSLGITSCIFDRSGYIYHGRVKAVAEGAREAGLNF